MRYIPGRHIFYILEMKNKSYKSISAHFFQRKKIEIIYENNFLWILQKPQFQRYVHKLVIKNLINAICYWN